VAATPGAFWKLTEDRRTRFLENVRTIGPQLAQPPPPPITCPLVGAVRTPVLVMRGERTNPYYNAVTDALLSCLPAATERFVIPAAGHSSYAANPAAFTEAVLGFLARHP
jgi:pimeloyl-ACP methyl ester carboxylesterase